MRSADHLAPDVLDRARGSLIGLAVADALYAKRTLSISYGHWTLATASALAVGRSFIRCSSGFSPRDAMGELWSMMQRGDYTVAGELHAPDLEIISALGHWLRTGALQASQEHTCAGCLPRAAIASLAHLYDPKAAAQLSRGQCRLTHGAPETVDACGILAELLSDLIISGDAADALPPWAFARVGDREDPAGKVLGTAMMTVAQSGSYENAVTHALATEISGWWQLLARWPVVFMERPEFRTTGGR